PIPPKAAARFAVRAFCALLRFPTRTVRKPQAGATSATNEASPARIDISEREKFGRPPGSRPRKILFRRPGYDGGSFTWAVSLRGVSRARTILLEGKPVQLPDVLADPEYRFYDFRGSRCSMSASL